MHEVSERLEAQLRILGNEYGPMGVALVAASMTDTPALIRALGREDRPGSEPVEALPEGGPGQGSQQAEVPERMCPHSFQDRNGRYICRLLEGHEDAHDGIGPWGATMRWVGRP